MHNSSGGFRHVSQTYSSNQQNAKTRLFSHIFEANRYVEGFFVQGYGIVWYCMVWYIFVWCGISLYGMVWHGISLYGVEWYGKSFSDF